MPAFLSALCVYHLHQDVHLFLSFNYYLLHYILYAAFPKKVEILSQKIKLFYPILWGSLTPLTGYNIVLPVILAVITRWYLFNKCILELLLLYAVEPKPPTLITSWRTIFMNYRNQNLIWNQFRSFWDISFVLLISLWDGYIKY